MRPDAERELDLEGPLQDLFQSAPLPAVPSLEAATRSRIKQRRTQQLLIRSAVAVAGVATICVAIQWLNVAPSAPHEMQIADALPLNDHELAALFAAPPVDPLALLDRQQQAAYQSLKQWERSR